MAPLPIDSTDARRYARMHYRLLFADLVLGLVILAGFQLSGASYALAHWWASLGVGEPLVILGYLACFGCCYYVLVLPLHFYGSFWVEHQFGLSRLTITGWLIRELKQVMLSAVLAASLVEGLYGLLRHQPEHWPIWATIGWVGVSVVLARVFPTLLLPLFYKTTPLEDDALKKRLLELCQRVGLSAVGVFRVGFGAETRKANAALAGLGKTRRILLADTLLANFTPDEIEGVLAHELAHQRYRHIVKFLLISAVGSWLAFTLTTVVAQWWVRGLRLHSLDDIAGFPMLMLWFSLLGFVGLPAQNALSRYFEWQADHFALATATRPAAFADALRRLAALNLADPNPPKWIVWLFYDPPPITERIQAATIH